MNPNIALGIQRPRFNSPQDQANALAIQNSRMQQQQNALAMQKAQADAELSTAKRNALAGAGGDWKQIAAVNMQYGDTDAALEIEKHLASQNKAARDAKLGEFDVFEKAAPLLTSPDTYSQGYAMLGELAPTIANRLPPQFTPELVPNVERMALGIKGWKEQERGNEANRIARERLARTPTVADRERIAAAGRSSISVETAQETSEKKELGKALVTEYSAVRDRADNAMNERQSLEQLRGIDVQTGRLEELRAGIASYAQALGIDPQRVGLPDPTNPQAFIATAQQLVLRVMQAQKGPQTENDAKRIEQTVASIKNTPAAKDFLIDAAIAVRERDIEQSDFYDNWRERTGSLDGARKAWRSYVDKTPLMGTNPSSGRPVFFRQFQNAMKQTNLDATDDQILMLWRQKYGR